MCVPRVAPTAACRFTKGGHITISQCVEPATSGLNLRKKSQVSASVLYIFQLPAMMGMRRIWVVGCRLWVVGKPFSYAIACRKLAPSEILEPKFSATVWPMSDRVERRPRSTPSLFLGLYASRGTYSRL